MIGPSVQPKRTLWAALTDDLRFGLGEFLVQADCEVVVTEALARADLSPAQLARRGLGVGRRR